MSTSAPIESSVVVDRVYFACFDGNSGYRPEADTWADAVRMAADQVDLARTEGLDPLKVRVEVRKVVSHTKSREPDGRQPMRTHITHTNDSIFRTYRYITGDNSVLDPDNPPAGVILCTTTTPAEVPRPKYVFLRAPGNGEYVYEQMQVLCGHYGWLYLNHRTPAWHLARGGADVVLVDVGLDRVQIGRLRATHYEPTPVEAEFGNYQPMRLHVMNGENSVFDRPTIIDPESLTVMGQTGASVCDVAVLADLVRTAFQTPWCKNSESVLARD